MGEGVAAPTQAEIDAAVDAAWAEDEAASSATFATKGAETLLWMEKHRHARHRAGGPPVPQRPRNQPRHPRAAHELRPGGAHGRLHRALGHARAPHSRWWTSGCTTRASTRAAKVVTERRRPRSYPAEQLRLRPGRAHHRPGAGDPGRRRARSTPC